MEYLISVIVPVYNVASYVEKSVSSILEQTYKNLEIILIDDGSTDGSSEICDNLKNKDLRIKVFHQENQGVSSARNLGLKMCTGDFIGFVDSDDIIQPIMYESLLNYLLNYHVDLVVSSYIYRYGDSRTDTVIDQEFDGVLYSDEALYEILQPYGYRGYLVTKLFRADVIKSPSLLLFNEQLKMMEDLDFVIHYLQRVKMVVFINESYYYYLMRKESAIHTLSNEEYIRSFECLIPFVNQYFSLRCQNMLRWSYWTSCITFAEMLYSQKKYSCTKDILERIEKERGYFLFQHKYSILGYLKKIAIEIFLRLKLNIK